MFAMGEAQTGSLHAQSPTHQVVVQHQESEEHERECSGENEGKGGGGWYGKHGHGVQQ